MQSALIQLIRSETRIFRLITLFIDLLSSWPEKRLSCIREKLRERSRENLLLVRVVDPKRALL